MTVMGVGEGVGVGVAVGVGLGVRVGVALGVAVAATPWVGVAGTGVRPGESVGDGAVGVGVGPEAVEKTRVTRAVPITATSTMMEICQSENCGLPLGEAGDEEFMTRYSTLYAL